MSDRESYGLGQHTQAYIVNPSRAAQAAAPGARRPSRSSYMPSMSPPPTIALPPTPTFAPSSTSAFTSTQHPMRISSQTSVAQGRAYSSHPYSAHSLASTPDIEQDPADSPTSHNDRSNQILPRSSAHNPSVQQSASPINSQAQSLNLFARQGSASSGSFLQEVSGSTQATSSSLAGEQLAGVPPGSYFAAYPHAHPQTTRDRSDSEVSGASAGSSSHTAGPSASGLPHGAPTTPPSQPAPGPRISPSKTTSAIRSSSDHSGSKSRTHKSKPSSRKALTAALELAKSAVLLDQSNDDPAGAVEAYANTVRLLNEVMEQVRRGEDGPSTGRASTQDASEAAKKKKHKSGAVAKEEEIRRLKAIHDTYADRLTILCLIYSIPHPSPSKAAADGTGPSDIQEPASEAQPSFSSVTTAAQLDTTTELPYARQDDQPNAPLTSSGDEPPQSKEQEDDATIRLAQQSSTTGSDLESDSDWERQGPAHRRNEGDPRDFADGSFADHRHRQQQLLQLQQQQQQPSPRGETYQSPGRLRNGSTIADILIGANADPPRVQQSVFARGAASDLSNSAPTFTPSTAFRTSVLPPPRPPPTGPLPTRPKIASGTVIPPQLLNQPLPPLPPAPPSQSPTEGTSQQSTSAAQSHPSLTRQSSSSSVSAVSSNASGSSSASNVTQPQPANLNPVPNSLPSLASLSLTPASLVANHSGLTGRPRGNSNAHNRNMSNAERLGAVNEEREEDDSASRSRTIPAAAPSAAATNSTPPPFRSRSSSMVSLKERDRARAQVLGNLPQAPLPPLPSSHSSTLTPGGTTMTKQASYETLLEAARVPSPGVASVGAKAKLRPRGNSVGSSTARSSEDYIKDGGSSSTTPIADAAPLTPGGNPNAGPTSAAANSGASSDVEASFKISSNPKEGTISQRRMQAMSAVPTSGHVPSGHNKLTSAVLSAATATSLGLVGRNRSSSNPAKWSGNLAMTDSTRPPMPAPPMSASGRLHFPGRSTKYQSFGLPSPSGSANASTASLVPTNTAPLAGVPASSPPPAPPALAILRPYHLMMLLRKSMTDRGGAYMTAKLHVPHEVWTQGSAKLTNTIEKIKVLDVLVVALDDLAYASVDFCGSPHGVAVTASAVDRKQGEKWATKLEDFDKALVQVGITFGKKLGVGGGFVAKKNVGMTAWGNKLFDRIASAGKPQDSPATYTSLLVKFFGQMQLVEEHSRFVNASTRPPVYSALPQELQGRIDTSLKSISDMFSKVVLTFVFRDLSVLLDKYHKTCDRWVQSNPGNPP